MQWGSTYPFLCLEPAPFLYPHTLPQYLCQAQQFGCQNYQFLLLKNIHWHLLPHVNFSLLHQYNLIVGCIILAQAAGRQRANEKQR